MNSVCEGLASAVQTRCRLSTEIAEHLQPYEKLLVRLETIPGIKRRLAEMILAEIGTAMQRFRKSLNIWPRGQGCVRGTTKVEENA